MLSKNLFRSFSWLIASMSSTAAALAAPPPPFVFTTPAAASSILEQSSGSLNWTGGDPTLPVSIKLFDVATSAAVAVVANGIPNSGSFYWSLPATLACKKDYRFYIENARRGNAAYGPAFTLKCLPRGAVVIQTPQPSGACVTQHAVTNIHYPQQTCAQSSPGFLANMMTMSFFKGACPAGADLLGVPTAFCQNAPIPGFTTGSVYSGIACCGQKLSAVYNTTDSYNAIFTPAQVQVFAQYRSDSECQSYFGPTSSATQVVVTNITTNPALNETYDSRSYKCILP